jgi:hypothetical protein
LVARKGKRDRNGSRNVVRVGSAVWWPKQPREAEGGCEQAGRMPELSGRQRWDLVRNGEKRETGEKYE